MIIFIVINNIWLIVVFFLGGGGGFKKEIFKLLNSICRINRLVINFIYFMVYFVLIVD